MIQQQKSVSDGQIYAFNEVKGVEQILFKRIDNKYSNYGRKNEILNKWNKKFKVMQSIIV